MVLYSNAPTLHYKYLEYYNRRSRKRGIMGVEGRDAVEYVEYEVSPHHLRDNTGWAITIDDSNFAHYTIDNYPELTQFWAC
ncbi:hypothetical protein J6590_065062 [Homalodisca vitripennis]|nr:hypothetical protein J6590_065062 [Homalodisca vitripennis]